MKKADTPNRKTLFLTAGLTFLLAAFILLYHYIYFLFPAPARGENAIWMTYISGPQQASSTPPFSSKLPERLPGASRLALGQKIDLNKASAKDLEALPGVGLKMAEQIIADREKRGLFRRPEDLMRVQGIKEKKFNQMKAFITINNGSLSKP